MQSKKNAFAIVGFGGFGREIASLIHKSTLIKSKQEQETDYYLVDDSADGSQSYLDIPVISMDAFLSKDFASRQYNITIANSQIRQRLAEKLDASDCVASTIFQPHAFIDQQTTVVGEGGLFCQSTTVTCNTQIGKHFHANIYSYIAHDCVIGDYVTFAPRVNCNGNVHIQNHAYIGTGAILRQGTTDKPLVIGEGAIVGMGAVVTKDVAPYTTVIGNPARVMEKKK